MAENRVRIIIEADGTQGTRTIKDVEKSLGDLEGRSKSAGSAARSMGDSMSYATGILKTLTAAMAAWGAYQFAKSFLDTAASFEQMEVSLRTITGSAAGAQKAMAWITEFTAQTPYQLDEVTQAFIRLQAQGLDAQKNLGILGDTASAMGRSLMDAVEMFADAVRGENERLKEFGVVASTVGDQITYSWSEGGRNMTITAEKNAESITAALMRIFSRFEGGMAEQSKTWGGMVSNMVDTWTLFQNKVMESGPFDALKTYLNQSLSEIKKLEQDGTLDRWARELADNIIEFFQIVAWAAELAVNSIRGLEVVFVASVEGIAKGLNTVLGWYQKILEIQRWITDWDIPGLKQFSADTQVGIDKLQSFRNELGFVGQAGEETREELMAAMTDFHGQMEAVRGKLDEFRKATKDSDTASRSFNSTTEALGSTVSFLGEATTKAAESMHGGGSSLSASAKKAQEALQNLNYEYEKALAAARGLSDPEIAYAEGMAAAAQRAQAIFSDTADKQIAEQERANEVALRKYTDFYNRVADVSADSLYTMFKDAGDGWQSLLDDMYDWFLKFVAQVVSQQIVVPLAMDFVSASGLGSLLGLGGSSATAAAAGQVSYGADGMMSTGSSSNLTSLLGLTGWSDTIKGWLNTEIFSWGGGANPLTSGGALTIGNTIGLLGGAYSFGTGISDLISGNYFSGATGLLGGAAMAISSIASIMGVATAFTAALGPIGFALAALGSLFGGFFDTSDPGIRFEMGQSYGDQLFGMEFTDVDLSDEEEQSLQNGMAQYLEAYAKALGFEWADVLERHPELWHASLDQSDLEEVQDPIARWSDDLIREYMGTISQVLYDSFAWNFDLITGLTGQGPYDFDEGLLNETVTEIFAYLNTLTAAGIDAGMIMQSMLDSFFSGDQGELGEFFSGIQAEGEEIGATMARAIATLDTIPDGLARMQSLVAGMDFSTVEQYLDQLEAVGGTDYADWIISTVIQDLSAGMSSADIMAYFLDAGLDAQGMAIVRQATEALYKGMSEGMSEEEAYQQLENQLSFTSNLIMPAIDAGMAAAIQSRDLDDFQAAFIDTLEAQMASAVTEVAMSKIFEQLLGDVFGEFGSLADLMGQYASGEIGIDELSTGFEAITAAIGPALEAAGPFIAEIYDLIDSFTSGEDAAEDTTSSLDELVQELYDLKQAAADTAYDLQSTINDLTGGDYSQLIETAWGGAWDAYYAYLAATDPESQIAALKDLQGWYDRIYEAQRDQIEAYYNARIAEQEALREQTQEYYDAAIAAKQDELEEVSKLREQTQEARQAEIDALQEQLEIATAFRQVAESTRGVIQSLLTSEANPADIYEQISISMAAVTRLQTLWAASSGTERAEYASQLVDAIQSYISLYGEGYQIPSDQYADTFGSMIDLLGRIQSDAESQGASVEDLQQQIADQTAAMEAELSSIDAQAEAINADIDALREAEDAALSAIDSSINSLQAQMSADLQAWDETMAEYYTRLEGWFADAYAAQIDSVSAEIESLALQVQANDCLNLANFQLDAIHNRIGAQNSMLSNVTAHAGGGYFDSASLIVAGEAGEEWLLNRPQLTALINGGSTRAGTDKIEVHITLNQSITAAPGTDAAQIGRVAARETVRQVEGWMKSPDGRRAIQDAARGR